MENVDYMPFGEQTPSVSGHKFTGKERDAESGLDYFGARYHASSTHTVAFATGRRMFYAR